MPDQSPPERAKRFYREVALGEGPEGVSLLLDGRPARTPARNVLALPSTDLAQVVAAEWRAQEDTLDPATMPLTRLVNIALDAVSPAPAPVRADIVKYAGSDLLCYRAGEPEGLVARQAEHWDGVLDWAREALGARFVLAQGVMFARQPAAALEAIERAVAPYGGLTLAALQAMTTLTGSALLALAVAHGRMDARAAWVAAHVDEDWNILHWGADAEAATRRAARWVEMEAAARAACAVRA